MKKGISGILTLLDEEDLELKKYGILKLFDIVDDYWSDIVDYLEEIECICENEDFEAREEGYLLVSKVYFHLGKYDECVKFALKSGRRLDVSSGDCFVDQVVNYCVGEYVSFCQSDDDGAYDVSDFVVSVVNGMFERCLRDGEYKQCFGLGFECRRLDVVRRSIVESDCVGSMVKYCLGFTVESLSSSLSFREKVLRLLVEICKERGDAFVMSECLLFLGDYKEMSELLKGLICDGGDDPEGRILMAYQIAFDVVSVGSQGFVRGLEEFIRSDDELLDSHATELRRLARVLKGDTSIHLFVDFLFRKNKTDVGILDRMKKSFEHHAILHSATVTANALMHCGTTVDTFIRKNLKWFSSASNWAKFSATAAYGVIHRGQIKNSIKILSTYLPTAITGNTQTSSSSPYSEGGSLYALGIIHANHYTPKIAETLSHIIHNTATKPIVLHGAALGLGLTAMCTGNIPFVAQLLEIVQKDDAVAGEAAAVAIGMILFGCYKKKERSFPSMKDDKDDDDDDEDDEDEEEEEGEEEEEEQMSVHGVVRKLISYGKETQHEKISRGCAVGAGMCFYGREEEANDVIAELEGNEDPVLRYGCMYLIGLAYCGTGKSFAVQKLLEFCVSDVSDDVRRAAVMNLGFVLCHDSEQLIRLLSLHAGSYNAHVRYGVALSLGIGLCGTMNLSAVRLLDTLAGDRMDFVRQGSYIALSMVLVQGTAASLDEKGDAEVGKMCEKYRKEFEKVWGGRDEVMAKMGAVLGSGIMDVGGRNATISIQKGGHPKMGAVLGMAMFSQYWFWHPYLHLMSLAVEPSCIICLDKEMRMPVCSFTSLAPPSRFAYPKMETDQQEKGKKERAKVSLSVVSRRKRRQRRNNENDDTTPFTPLSPKPQQQQQQQQEQQKMEDEEREEDNTEPTQEELHNPARVTQIQRNFISFEKSQVKPVKKAFTSGILMVKINEKQENFLKMKDNNTDMKEPEPPKPFRFTSS